MVSFVIPLHLLSGILQLLLYFNAQSAIVIKIPLAQKLITGKYPSVK